MSTVAAEYKGVKEEFQFQHRPLWGWIEGQVQDPKLVPYFHWDAQRLYKYDGTRWVRYIEDPWTADMFWDVQVSSHLSQIVHLSNRRRHILRTQMKKGNLSA